MRNPIADPYVLGVSSGASLGEDVEVAIGDAKIVRGASIELPAGAFVGVVGPNGCGKTTLLRAIYRSLRPAAGTIDIGGQDPWRVPARQAAQRTAVVAQESVVGLDFTVAEDAAMGRIPHKRGFDRESPSDRVLVAEALSEVGMAEMASRAFASLSGRVPLQRDDPREHRVRPARRDARRRRRGGARGVLPPGSPRSRRERRNAAGSRTPPGSQIGHPRCAGLHGMRRLRDLCTVAGELVVPTLWGGQGIR